MACRALQLAVDKTLLIVLSLCCIPKAATKGRVPYNALLPPIISHITRRTSIITSNMHAN